MFDVIAFSASILIAKICSAVLRPARRAAGPIGILVLLRFQHLLIIQMASNFHSTDNGMIGRRFEDGPGFLLGFRRGLKIPSLICSGYSPVLAILFSS